MKGLLLSALLLVSFSVFSAGKGIDITVNLSPAGSFQIETSKVKGKVVKSGDSYSAKKLYVKVKDLKTGIDLRDEHMKKRLGPKTHPKITVTSLKAKGGKGKAVIEIKGIKKPVSFTYDVAGKIFNAEFKVNLTQFKIKDLKYMGVGAKKIVTVKASIPLKSK
jgi:polyisoprenoid-binding protein YceI